MVWLELFNFMHFVGLAFGLGGATVATIISSKADKDKELSKSMMKIMPSISKLIFSGLILLIISGIALPFFIQWPLNKKMLTIKHILVVWVVIIGIAIGRNSKKAGKYAPKSNQKPSIEFLKAKKRIKSFSKINLFLWYLITILSAFV